MNPAYGLVGYGLTLCIDIPVGLRLHADAHTHMCWLAFWGYAFLGFQPSQPEHPTNPNEQPNPVPTHPVPTQLTQLLLCPLCFMAGGPDTRLPWVVHSILGRAVDWARSSAPSNAMARITNPQPDSSLESWRDRGGPLTVEKPLVTVQGSELVTAG